MADTEQKQVPSVFKSGSKDGLKEVKDLGDTNYNVDRLEAEKQSGTADKLDQVSLKSEDVYHAENLIERSDLSGAAELLDALHIADPTDSSGRQHVDVGMPAAGIFSPSRKYKMASDIFGTGMDRSWGGESESPSPQKVEPSSPQPKTPSEPPPRNRNEPSSFKITELPSDDPAGGNDSGSNNPIRKARESAGNPLTGQGYNDEGTKTAKRYYEGSNANQKLW